MNTFLNEIEELTNNVMGVISKDMKKIQDLWDILSKEQLSEFNSQKCDLLRKLMNIHEDIYQIGDNNIFCLNESLSIRDKICDLAKDIDNYERLLIIEKENISKIINKIAGLK